MALLHDEIPIAMIWDNKYNHNLRDRDKLVFGEIFTMINQGKPFIMSNKKLGKRLGYSSKSISRSIKSLIDLKWITTKMVIIKSKNGNKTAREVNGINLERCLKFSQKVHRQISLGGMDKHVHTDLDNSVQQIYQSNRSGNSTDNGKPNYRQMIVKDLESLMVNINTFVGQDIDNWLNTYDPKLILKAIHQVGSTSPSPAWVTKDISTQLARGCKTYQPKRSSNNYGHQPIKGHIPNWAKDNYKPNLHPTSKKMQRKIQKQLYDLKHRGNKK